jgi:hypothetical protein
MWCLTWKPRRTFCMVINCSLPRLQQPTAESWNEPDESSANSHIFRTINVDYTSLSLSDSSPLKMAPSVKNYRSSLRNIPEERSFHLLRGTCLKEPIIAHRPCHRLQFKHSTVTKQFHLLSFSIQITHMCATCHDNLILITWMSRSSSAHIFLQPPLTPLLPPSYVQMPRFSSMLWQCPNLYLSSNVRHQVSNPGHTKLDSFVLVILRRLTADGSTRTV